ncbi:hypothetical protein DFH07DRAFT_745220, partial [Mycena maculata]
RFFKPYPAETDYPTIEGVLHLSNKYQVDSLRKRSLVHLGSVRLFEEENPSKIVPRKTSWTAAIQYLPSIIILCREVSALWILPTVFRYYAQLYDHRTILGGHMSFDGRRIFLSQEDQLAVLTGARVLHTRKMSEFLDFIWYPQEIEGCKYPVKCLIARNELRRTVERTKGDNFPDDVAINLDQLKACRGCKAALQKSHRLAVETRQQSMPEVFGLPDWKTLDAMEASALE